MKIIKQTSRYFIYLALAVVIAYNIVFPINIGHADDELTALAYTGSEASQTNYQLPEVKERAPRQEKSVRITGYSSTVDQCDGDPFTTASGSQVHVGTVANNCLPFGTKLKFPELFGDQIFVVEDRMNSRYGCEVYDIWMPERSQALAIGSQYTKVQVF